MRDQFGRTIDYLRISITDRCNLRCQYCMPAEGAAWVPHSSILTFEEIEAVVRVLVRLGIRKVRLTGGEPLVRRGVVSLVERLASVEGIDDLSLTTNGLLLKPLARPLRDAGLHRVNVSLDSLHPSRFAELTRGGRLQDVLDGIEAAFSEGLGPVKLNVVLVNGFNTDEIEPFVELTKTRDIEVRFIELMPIAEQARWSLDHFVSNQLVLRTVPQLEPLTGRPASSPAELYRVPGWPGRVGLISPVSCSFCAGCNRVRLTADGQLKTCLHSDEGTNLRAVLREGGDGEAAVRDALERKPRAHHLAEGRFIQRGMSRIGG